MTSRPSPTPSREPRRVVSMLLRLPVDLHARLTALAERVPGASRHALLLAALDHALPQLGSARVPRWASNVLDERTARHQRRPATPGS